MNLQVFLEWFHRLVASSLGLLTVSLAAIVWLWRRRLPQWLPWGASFSVFLILVQGLLGGLTVTQLLRFDIVTAHLGTGLLFFATIWAIGLMLVPYQHLGSVGKLPWLGGIAVLLVYLQSLLGALVASQWAVHQCLGNAQLCSVMHSHLLGVLPASLATLSLGIWAWRQPALHPWLRLCGQTGLILLALQVCLGVTTLRLKLQLPLVTIAHQLIGALLLGILVAFTVFAFRDRFQSKANLFNQTAETAHSEGFFS
jgi:cytochrome c oxidase assembly protein subunit 15